MMARSKLVLAVLGAAAALAAAGCGSVTASAGHASAAGGQTSAAGGHTSAGGGHASATASAGGGSSAASSAPAKGQPNAVGGPIRGASQPLCSAPGSASQVVITKTGTAGPLTPGGPVVAAYRSGTPASVVKGAAEASELARAVCGLPAMTAGVVRCPQLDGVSYQLTFTAGGRLLPAVVVQPSGCQTVTGAGVVRTAASRPAFLQLLISMAGVVRVPGVAHLPGASVGGPAAGGA
jgi:hypothetical protein